MASVKYYLRKLKGPEAVIKARFTLPGTGRFQINTDERINPKHWDKKSQSARFTAPDYVAVNLYLSEFKSKLLSLYRDNRDKSFSEFKALAQGAVITDEKKSPLAIFDKFLSQYEQDKDKKTWQKYKALRVHLEGVKVDGFGQMDYNFLDTFRSSLYSKDLQDSSVYKYISNLKTFLSWSEERGYKVNTIYKKWEVVHRVKPVISLSYAELQRLESAILPSGMSIGRDFLCLEARTGQRISDLMRFDKKDFHDNRWTFYRKKGKSIKTKQVTVHFTGFCAPALEILKRHKFIIPKLSEQKINKWIKRAAKHVKINQLITIEKWQGGKCITEQVPKWKKISTHVGRKTFITLALHFMEPKIVMELAGIDSYQTLKHYDGKSEEGIVRHQLEEMETRLKAV